MDITKESFLKAEDAKNRDAMLFDMLNGISHDIKECNEIRGRVEKCEKNIAFLRGTGITASAVLSGIGAWFGLK